MLLALWLLTGMGIAARIGYLMFVMKEATGKRGLLEDRRYLAQMVIASVFLGPLGFFLLGSVKRRLNLIRLGAPVGYNG